jgi:hypothetical protein
MAHIGGQSAAEGRVSSLMGCKIDVVCILLN